jgi:glycosyltransferase involved in cell wall biosynthesis
VPPPLKVLHVITGLATGGAETMLVKILSALPAAEVSSMVVALGAKGPMVERVEALGVPLVSLGSMRSLGGLPAAPRAALRLARIMRAFRPDAVQCWMYHANLLGGLAARMAGSPPVIWGLRQSDLDPRRTKATTRLIANLGARLSRRLPTRILACGHSVRSVHKEMGYDTAHMVVVPNGFDGDIFRPDRSARARVRCELGVGEDDLLIGLPARFDPQKDHASFFKAAAIVHDTHPRAVFALCGTHVTADNGDLRRLLASAKLPQSAVRLMGERRDMPAVMAALDIVVSASAYGEGFPNVLGEGMAAGALPIATDSGDSRLIVEGIGYVVPVADPVALARAMRDALELPVLEREERKEAARARVLRNYALSDIAQQYLALWRAVARERS